MTETDTPIISPDEPSRPPLWKQLVGAMGGAAIALALYVSYEAASPALTAWLSIPETPRSDPGEVTIQDSASQEMQKRIASRARVIAEEFSERPERPVAETDAVPVAAKPASNSGSAIPPITAIVQASGVGSEEAEFVAIKEKSARPASEPIAQSESVLAETVMISNAPALPSSGVGVWLLGFLSGLGAIGWKYRARLHQEVISF